jgi:hypothetical protein
MLEAEALDQLRLVARGRPLVVDYFARHYRGENCGDITVGFPTRPLEPCYRELEPMSGIRVLAPRHLVPVLEAGAIVRLTRGRGCSASSRSPSRGPTSGSSSSTTPATGDERLIGGAAARPMSSDRVWTVALLAAFIVLVVMLGLSLLEVFELLPGT